MAVEGEAKFVDTLDEGRAEGGGKGLDGAIIDLGLANLVVVVGIRRVILEVSAPSPKRPCVGDCPARTVSDRLGPSISDFGLPPVDAADIVVAPLPAPEDATCARAAAKAPGLGNLLGDMFRETSIVDAEADTTASFFLVSRALLPPSFLGSAFFGTLLSPAVGWRKERVRLSPVDEDEDDMVSGQWDVVSGAAA